jgi:hypothetical protein
LTSADLGPSGEDSPSQGREFALHVTNDSSRTLALPRSPDFGWRVDILNKKVWKLKAEGGPVRRINPTDEHLIAASAPATGSAAAQASAVGSAALPDSAQMVEIPPAQAQDFRFYLPAADPVLRPDAGLTTLKLTVYWAAPAELAQSNRSTPTCGLAAEWVVTMRP